MKCKQFFFLLLALIAFSQLSLFGEVESQMRGKVLDMDTGQPVNGAWVNLFGCSQPVTMINGKCMALLEMRTDGNGNFGFPDLRSGWYFLVVIHRDYVVYGPAFELSHYLLGNTRKEFVGKVDRSSIDYNFFDDKPDRNFFLEEGQITQLVIKLEQAAKLHIDAKMKTPAGTFVYKDTFEILIEEKPEEKIYWVEEIEGGEFESRCMPPYGRTKIKYGHKGFGNQIRGILLEKGKVTKFEILFDYTTGQSIHGRLVSKETKNPLSSAIVTLYPHSIDRSLRTVSDSQGEFWLGGIKTGKYDLEIRHPKITIFEKILSVDINDKIEINMEL